MPSSIQTVFVGLKKWRYHLDINGAACQPHGAAFKLKKLNSQDK